VAHEDAKDDPGFGSRASDRLTAFSDAVVAIAITLLAIDLPVPSGLDWPHFRASLSADYLQYLAFLISFLAIAGTWSQHHDLFRYVRGTDSRMRSLHLQWLLTIILIPFITKLLFTGGHSDTLVHALEWGTYALVQVLDSVLLLTMVRHLDAHDQLEPSTPRRVVSSVVGQSWALIIGFGVSIPLFFVNGNAWVFWILGPLLVRRARALHHRRAGARPEDSRPGPPEKPGPES
jgi:uncharacterized membrane protein